MRIIFFVIILFLLLGCDVNITNSNISKIDTVKVDCKIESYDEDILLKKDTIVNDLIEIYFDTISLCDFFYKFKEDLNKDNRDDVKIALKYPLLVLIHWL